MGDFFLGEFFIQRYDRSSKPVYLQCPPYGLSFDYTNHSAIWPLPLNASKPEDKKDVFQQLVVPITVTFAATFLTEVSLFLVFLYWKFYWKKTNGRREDIPTGGLVAPSVGQEEKERPLRRAPTPPYEELYENDQFKYCKTCKKMRRRKECNIKKRPPSKTCELQENVSSNSTFEPSNEVNSVYGEAPFPKTNIEHLVTAASVYEAPSHVMEDDQIGVHSSTGNTSHSPTSIRGTLLSSTATDDSPILLSLATQPTDEGNLPASATDEDIPMECLRIIEVVNAKRVSGPSVTTDAVAVTTEAEPVTTEALAVTTEALAVTTETESVSTEAVAVTTEAVPVTTEAVPVTTEALPVTTKAEPVTTEALVVTTEAVAVTTEAESVTTEAGAVTTEAVPVTTEAVPVTTEAVPVTTEALPVTTEAVDEESPSSATTGKDSDH